MEKKLYAYNQKSLKKGTYVEIQNDFQNMFSFYDKIFEFYLLNLNSEF